MIARNVEARIAKLEARQPAPPSPLEGMTSDELTVLLLEHYATVLADPDAAEEEQQEARAHTAKLTAEITATVNFAAGRWALPPGFQNYRERQASMKAHWERLQPTRGEYVAAMNYSVETCGFPVPGRGEPAAPGLMARRAKSWQHPIVQQIVENAPAAPIVNKLFRKCRAAEHGNSADCFAACSRQCLNKRYIGHCVVA